MNLDKELTKLLDGFGINLKDDLRSNLRKKLDERSNKHKLHPKVSKPKIESRLEASIKDNVSYGNGSLKFTLTMNDYWEVVENGRKPSSVSRSGQDKISEWAATRRVAESIRLTEFDNRVKRQSEAKEKNPKRKKWVKLKKMPFEQAKKGAAFLIARKLKNKRLEPTNFFSEVIKDGRIEELKTKISELIKTDIIIEIRNGVNS